MFPWFKATHVVMAATTLVLFLVRVAWAYADSPRLRQPLVRRLPHVIDTLLLASALATAITIGQYPFVDNWLTAKFFALLAYITLGHVALWRVRNNAQRTAALTAAVAAFCYIMLVAKCHDPMACLG